MEAKFPTVELVKQAYVQTFAFKKGLLITLAFLLAMIGALFVLIIPMVALSRTPEGSAALGFVMVVLMVAVFLFVAGWVFNYWVRYGAEGRDAVDPLTFRGTVGPAFVTGIKLFFIGLLLALIAAVIYSVGSVVGLAPSFQDLQDLLLAGDEDALVRRVAMIYLIIFTATCGVYSVFSSNLTKTALGRKDEEVGPPHVFEFAVVLFVAYAVMYVPLVLLQMVLPQILGSALELVVGLLITAVVPVAHGLRYDWQRQVYAEAQGGDEDDE